MVIHTFSGGGVKFKNLFVGENFITLFRTLPYIAGSFMILP